MGGRAAGRAPRSTASPSWSPAAARPIDDVRSTAAYRVPRAAACSRAARSNGRRARSAADALECTVNGERREVDGVWEGESLLYVLRERMGLPGSKNACEQGECGSCSVYLDGTLVCSCLVLAGRRRGREVVTVEGLAAGDEELHPIQEAFLAAGAVQCGFCTPGLIVATHDLLARNPDAERARDPRGARGQPLPLHRLREDPRRGQGGRGGADRVSAAGASPIRAPVRDGIGESVGRPDGTLKVRGEFAYSSDLWADGMLWGTTLRSPHPYARIRSIDFAAGARAPRRARRSRLTRTCPGRKTYGLELPDQPVLAIDVVRYQGEPVAIVAADHPETARRAAELIGVDYEVLEPLVDMDDAVEAEEPRLHEGGNVLRHLHVVHGDVAAAAAEAELVVEGEYEIGMQDQAFLGPESGLAIPSEDGGVDLYVATQWLHVDRAQVAASLDLPPERVRITNAGVGGAFGGREDLSMQIHGCMLALHTGRPVKMVYSREESFFGHVHRHPARLRYEHGATRDGRLVYVRARIVLDGGAYASSSKAVCLNAATTAAGPYECPNADIDSYVVYTNNPPCGAMRGFGAVQTCFAYEAQMDKLAAAAGIDPRRAAAAERDGHRDESCPRARRSTARRPCTGCSRSSTSMPMPDAPDGDGSTCASCPAASRTRRTGRGCGAASATRWASRTSASPAGFDDYSTARVRLAMASGEPQVEVHTAACEVGQGGIMVQAQIARDVLGVERVIVLPSDTSVGNAGSSSASRQTWFTGGAVRDACEAVRAALLAAPRARRRRARRADAGARSAS